MINSIVFGATGGIGASLCKELAKKDHRLTACSRSEEILQQLSSSLSCNYTICDVLVETQVEDVFRKVTEEGEIKAVALCVGSIILKPIHLLSSKEWEETVNINLTSAFHICKYAAKYMKSGSVLLFSSAAAQIGMPNHEAISAVKSGVEGLVRSAAATYASRPLRFNAIAPGLVRTRLSEKLLSTPAGEKSSLAYHGLNRIGEPEDISTLAAWLLGEESSWVTGQIFNVDGGLSSIKRIQN